MTKELSHDDNEMLLSKAKEGCIKSRNKLIENNMGLIYMVANKFNPTGIEHDDLVNEGVFGVIRAIELFDSSKGFRFSTYATIWIRQAISRAISCKSRNVRWPVHFFQKKIALHSITESSSNEDIGMTIDEVADTMDVSKGRAKMLLESDIMELSMDYQYGDDQTMHDHLVDETSTQNAIDEMFNETIVTVLENCLNEKQFKVIKYRFGLDSHQERSLNDIGEEMGISRERVRQIEVKALNEIARVMRIDFNILTMPT